MQQREALRQLGRAVRNIKLVCDELDAAEPTALVEACEHLAAASRLLETAAGGEPLVE